MIRVSLYDNGDNQAKIERKTEKKMKEAEEGAIKDSSKCTTHLQALLSITLTMCDIPLLDTCMLLHQITFKHVRSFHALVLISMNIYREKWAVQLSPCLFKSRFIAMSKRIHRSDTAAFRMYPFYGSHIHACKLKQTKR